MKFKTKVKIIEAEQFIESRIPKGVFIEPANHNEFYVVTIHGQKTKVIYGDWIMPEPDGIHYYPCKPDIFNDRYEAVNE